MILINFIKNNKLLALFLFILMTVLSAILFAMQLTNTQQLEIQENIDQNPVTNINQVPFKNDIKPGETTLDQIERELGKPESEFENEKEGLTVFKYKTENPYLFNEVYVRNNDTILIREPVDYEERSQENKITSQYGLPQYKLYNQKDPDSPFNLYVYASKGIAYEGHSDGTILRIWYFEPTNITDFIKNIAPDFSFQPSASQHY